VEKRRRGWFKILRRDATRCRRAPRRGDVIISLFVLFGGCDDELALAADRREEVGMLGIGFTSKRE